MARTQPIEIPVQLAGIEGLSGQLQSIRSEMENNLGFISQLADKSKEYKEAFNAEGIAGDVDRINQALVINEQRLNNAVARQLDMTNAARGLAVQMTAVNKQINDSAKGGSLGSLADDLSNINNEVKDFNLGATFDEMYEGMKPLTNQIGELEDRLYQLANEGKANSEEFQALTQEAGRLRSIIIETDKAVDQLGDNTGFERVGSSLGEVGSELLSLDFVGASKRAEGLQMAMNSITAESVQEQMDGLNKTFAVLGKVSGQAIMGLVKNVGAIARAFASFGKALLLNPIFLIATAFIAIVGVIGLLMDKLGFLQPILDGIGAVFGFLGDVIDAVVQGIKDFLDWIGLTDYAAEDSAKKQTKAAEKKADAYERASTRIQESLDEEIKIAKINGEDTVDLEIKKQKVIKRTAEVRLEALKAKYEENKLTKELDADEIKDLKEKLEVQRQLIRGASSEIRVIKAQEAADTKKEAADEAENRRKEAESASKEAQARAKERAQQAQKFQEDRLKAERELKDLELASMKDGAAKEIAINQEKYARIFADLQANENLTKEERERFAEAYKLEQDRELEAIRQQRITAAQKEQDDLTALLEKSKIDRQEAIKRDLATEQDLKLLMMQEGFDKELAALELARTRELENKNLTVNEVALIDERYRQEKAAKEAEQREAKKAAEKELQDRLFEIAETGASSALDLNDLVFEIKKGRLKDGSKAEEEAARKNFEINKKIQISTASIQGIQGVINALTAASTIPEPFGSILKAANAVKVGVSTALNIAKIKATQYGGVSTPITSGNGSTPSTINAPSASNVNLFGSNNNLNNVGAQNNQQQGVNVLNVKAYVAQDEMTIQQKIENSTLKMASL